MPHTLQPCPVVCGQLKRWGETWNVSEGACLHISDSATTSLETTGRSTKVHSTCGLCNYSPDMMKGWRAAPNSHTSAAGAVPQPLVASHVNEPKEGAYQEKKMLKRRTQTSWGVEPPPYESCHIRNLHWNWGWWSVSVSLSLSHSFCHCFPTFLFFLSSLWLINREAYIYLYI